jgi:hypothetical protein
MFRGVVYTSSSVLSRLEYLAKAPGWLASTALAAGNVAYLLAEFGLVTNPLAFSVFLLHGVFIV